MNSSILDTIPLIHHESVKAAAILESSQGLKSEKNIGIWLTLLLQAPEQVLHRQNFPCLPASFSSGNKRSHRTSWCDSSHRAEDILLHVSSFLCVFTGALVSVPYFLESILHLLDRLKFSCNFQAAPSLQWLFWQIHSARVKEMCAVCPPCTSHSNLHFVSDPNLNSRSCSGSH